MPLNGLGENGTEAAARLNRRLETSLIQCGDVMAPIDIEQEPEYFQSIRSTSDGTETHLFVCILVFVLFSLFILGMSRSQLTPESSRGDLVLPARQLNPDISDFDDASKH